MSYLNGQFEDESNDPLFLTFSKIFEDSSLHSLNQKIRKFESTHPHLTLVSFDNFSKTIPVTSGYLFSDATHRYSELIYTYELYKEILYYEPDPDLAKWLTMVDEFAELKIRTKKNQKIH